jgi:hypothetical protein
MTIINIPETPRLLVPIAQGKVSKLLPTIACHILKIVPADEELIFSDGQNKNERAEMTKFLFSRVKIQEQVKRKR